MKRLFLFVLFTLVIAGCTSKAPIGNSDFPLDKGTTWVYSYEAYDSAPSDPTQIIKATYQLTETIVETGTMSTDFVVHVKREYKSTKADSGWSNDPSSQPNEFWYVVNDNQVFQSYQPLDNANINLDELIPAYEFPLSLSKSWCLVPHKPRDPKELAGCDFVGKRQVTDQGHYQTPAGNFDHCYDLVDYYNGGNIFQEFCSGVGIVFMKFDHAGSKFGFEQTLIKYSKGTR